MHKEILRCEAETVGFGAKWDLRTWSSVCWCGPRSRGCGWESVRSCALQSPLIFFERRKFCILWCSSLKGHPVASQQLCSPRNPGGALGFALASPSSLSPIFFEACTGTFQTKPMTLLSFLSPWHSINNYLTRTAGFHKHFWLLCEQQVLLLM